MAGIPFTLEYYHEFEDQTPYQTDEATGTVALGSNINYYYNINLASGGTPEYHLLSDDFTSTDTWNDVYSDIGQWTRDDVVPLYDPVPAPEPTPSPTGNKVIKKIMYANQEYTVLGSGGSEGEAHEFITQAAYDQLTPAQKAEKVYMIKDSGTPSTVLTAGTGIDITNNEISADMSTAVYDNTTSGLTATNVQDAIDEVDGKFGAITGEGTPVNNGDFIGQMYKDTISGNMYIWNGSVWGGLTLL